MTNARSIKILGAAALALLTAGCSLTPGPSINQIAARDLAASVADPTTGTLQEVTDLGFAFFGVWGLGPQPWSLFRASDFALYLAEGLLSSQLAWSSPNSDYELALSRTFTAGEVTGTATVNLSIAFLESTNGTGMGVKVDPLTSGTTPLSSIHSIVYNRQIQADFTNTISHAERKTNSSSSFLVTSLTIGGPNPGFTLSGSKTTNFTHLYADGTSITGSLSQTIPTSSPIVVTAALQSDGTYLVSATGQITVSYNATITKADGTTQTVSRTATVTLNGQQIVRVDVDGTEVDVDITTGDIE